MGGGWEDWRKIEVLRKTGEVCDREYRKETGVWWRILEEKQYNVRKTTGKVI